MSRPLRIPHPETALHLYRHLLREASYLPRLARSFADAHIKAHFGKHRDDEGERNRQRIRRAHQELRVLRAANQGDMARMRRVLLRAFGRVGRRRRDLMAELLPRDTPTNTEELAEYAAETQASASQKRVLDWLDSWDTERLRALACSQVQAGLTNSPKANITLPQTVPAKSLPRENSWGRPLPAKVERTKLKKLWKALADRCMPPLPKEEWDLLEAVVDRRISTEDRRWIPPPRRPVARSAAAGDEGARSWDWQSYAVKPVAAVDRPANRRNKLLTGAVDDNTPTGDPEPIGCHKYTIRKWRRMLGHIWHLSPTMARNPGGRGWDVVWGKPDFHLAPATPRHLEFFEDLPDTRRSRP